MSSITVSQLKSTRYFSESKLQSFNAKDQLFKCSRRISCAFFPERGTVPRTMAVLKSLSREIRPLDAPSVLGARKILMTRHPRMKKDSAHACPVGPLAESHRLPTYFQYHC